MLHLTDQTQTNIFTTNYDSLIEGYCKEPERHYNLVDGFEYDASSRFNKWSASSFDQEPNLDTICLFKLHGSLNWKRHRKYGIVKLEDIERMMKNDGQYIDDLLIRPTRSPKEEEQPEPFKTLMNKFKERVANSTICIVVGYPFRDEGINEVFDGFMKQGGKLLIISPDATKEFTENFINHYHPNEASYHLLDDKVTIEELMD